MRRKNINTSRKSYKHLTESERYKIEGLLEAKRGPKEIARLLGRDPSTIYREINRGSRKRLDWELRERLQYRADVAQADYIERGRNKERSLKIGKDKRLEEYIRIKLVEEKFSPDAIIGQIKASQLNFEGMISTKTLYNYIDAGIFSGISNKDLWEKKETKKRRYKAVMRPSRLNRDCRSIEKRPTHVNNREEYGHWEGDTVKGPQGSKASILTLTERKSREEIMIKLDNASQEAVKAAIDGLEKKYGPIFRVKFKSITFDNGSEFLDWRSLEISLGKRRTTVYFAHSYCSWERGSNENQNRMIRRYIPKGTNIALFDQSEIDKIQNWMNDYPRKILGYRTPNQMAVEFLQGRNLN
jgi:IS30 family transposase